MLLNKIWNINNNKNNNKFKFITISAKDNSLFLDRMFYTLSILSCDLDTIFKPSSIIAHVRSCNVFCESFSSSNFNQ